MKEDVENLSLPLAMTVAETAEVLQVGKTLVYELVYSGKLRSLRIGRKIRIPRGALLEFLDDES